MTDEHTELRSAVGALLDAIDVEGPNPAHHRRIMNEHRRQWPTLWAAIDRLRNLTEVDEFYYHPSQRGGQ